MSGTYPLKVVRRRRETEDTVSLWFDVPKDLATPMTYRTGQFIAVEEELGGESVTRQYSLASVPELDDRLQITVKRIPGGRMSTWLVDEVEEGDILEVESPRGRLYVPAEEPRHYVLVAAGSGIVPLAAIARHVRHRVRAEGVDHRVTLLYGNRREDTIILRDEVDDLAAQGVHVEHVLSRPPAGWTGATGHVDPGFLESRWDGLADERPLSVFLCGPEDFMNAAEKWLVEHGVPLDDIRKESFDLVLNDDDSEPSMVVPDGTAEDEEEDCFLLTAVLGGEEIEVAPEPGERLLSALLRVSEDVPFSCQEGTCSSCIVRLTDGSVAIRPHVLQTLRPGDLDEGLILACLSQARTESVRVDFDDI